MLGDQQKLGEEALHMHGQGGKDLAGRRPRTRVEPCPLNLRLRRVVQTAKSLGITESEQSMLIFARQFPTIKTIVIVARTFPTMLADGNEYRQY